jgi:hypothetical protein
MVFHLPRLNLPLLVVTMVAMVSSTDAQSSDRSIIFSTPKSDDTPAVTPSLAPQNSQLPVLPDSLQAPDPALHFQAPNDLLVGPPPTVITPRSQRMEKLLEDRKNWTLMTPEEIMGVTPADELLQSPDRDALGRKKDTTPLQRFLDRENQMHSGPTNGWQIEQDNLPWKPSRNRDDLNPFAPGSDNTVNAAKKLIDYLNGRQLGEGTANRNNNNYGWDSFSPTAQQTAMKPDPEQLAAMDRFRQLLNPAPVPTTEASPDNKYFPATKTAPVVDPYLNQPYYVLNPAGSSYTPLTSGVGKPSGLTPLPGIVTPGITLAPAPAWAPQPAPWLIQGPQPFVMPQRKF